jgi:hypothetical protein
MWPTPRSESTALTSAAPNNLRLIHWIFRVAFLMEFVGHGAFGIIGKAAWVPYFGVMGISEPMAWRLMPIIGAIDISLGIVTFLRPMRGLILYGSIWGLWTALLRPLSGEPFWETLERAGNYGVPLAFLLWSGWPRRASEWFARIHSNEGPLSSDVRSRVFMVVRVSLALLLIGHGGFGAVVNKAVLAKHYGVVGLHALPFGSMPLVPAVGWFEIALGCAVLAWPATGLLVFIAAWKIACELLYPISGAPFWEFVERGGSYAAPLLLLALASYQRRAKTVAMSEVATPKGVTA